MMESNQLIDSLTVNCPIPLVQKKTSEDFETTQDTQLFEMNLLS